LGRQRAGAAGIAGIVDGCVELAEDLDGAFDQRADVVFDGDVGTNVLGPATQLPEFRGQRLAFLVAPPGDNDGRTVAGEAVAVARPIPAKAPVISTTCSLIISFPRFTYRKASGVPACPRLGSDSVGQPRGQAY